MLLMLTACNVQKHVEMDKVTTTENRLDITEKQHKNTTRFIVITKYQEKKDSITGEYPIESVTEIKEVNNDKITTEVKGESNEQVKEQTKEDTKTGSDFKWYLVCFIAGSLTVLLIIGIIKFYIRWR